MSIPDIGSSRFPNDAPDAIAVWVDGHPDDGILHAGLDDQLAAAESAAVADHVSRCATCRTRVAEAHGHIGAARRILKKTKDPATEAVSTPIAAPIAAAATSVAGANAAPVAAPSVTHAAAPVAPTAAPPSAAAAPAPVAETTSEPVAAPSAPVGFGAKPSVSAPSAPPQARPQSAPPVVAPIRTKKTAYNWSRVAPVAAVLLVVASGALVWRAVGTDFFATATPAPAVTPAHPAPRPDTVVAAAAVEASATGTDTTAIRTDGADGALDTRLEEERRSRMATEAVPADPNKRTGLQTPAASTLAAFDSLVLTRRTCVSQCDEYALYVNNTGAVRYELRARNGQVKSVNGATTDPSLKRMSALVSSLLFETQAVPISGRSICTVFDDAHVPALQLMVARGASRALNGNSCSATSKDLLKLGAQIDSLAGTEGFQKSLQAEAK